MKTVIKILFSGSILLMFQGAWAQKYTLDNCLDLATKSSPLSRQAQNYAALDEMTEKNVSNAYLPAVFLNGQATYQTDVFSFPNNPIFDVPIIPKDQYRFTLDVRQQIYDGGMVKNKKLAESARIMSEAEAVNVDLYDIKATVTKLYFSSLIYQENIRTLNTLLAELREEQNTIDSRVRNGVLLKTASDNFKKQILTTEQQILSAELEQRAVLQMLSKWIGEDISSADSLATPVLLSSSQSFAISRPELKLLDTQKNYFESMKSLSSVSRRPKLWAVAQAGVGQPNAYNFLEVNFTDFYFVGLKMSWQLLDYGKARREKNIFSANQSIIETKRQNIEKNIDIQLTRANAEVQKLKELVKKDQEILALQQDIVKRSFSQLQNGVINTTDYLTELNTRTQLQIKTQIHSIQLSQAQYNCLNISGNL